MEPYLTKKDLHEALDSHSKTENVKIKAMIDTAIGEANAYLLSAFPGGVDQHREIHKQMMVAAEAEEMFWRDLKKDIATKSIWGILHILFILTLGSIAVKLGIASVFGIVK
jgi:hypothetical protein